MDETLASRNNGFNLTEAFEKAGDSHKYQKTIIFIFYITIMSQCFLIMGGTYLYQQPPLLCDGKFHKPCTSIGNTCIEANMVIVDPIFTRTNFITDFQLFCQNRELSSVAQSQLFLGNILGSFALCFIGDQYGRKKAILYSWGISTIGSLGIFLASNVQQLIVMNFIFGFGSFATYVLSFVVLNEICSKELRQKACIGVMIAFSSFQILSAVIYYLIPFWRIIFFFFVLVPAIVGYYCLLKMDETPRYYYSKGLMDKTYRVLSYIAEFNNINFQLTQEDIVKQQESNSSQYGYLDLFKYSSLRLASIGFIFVSFAAHLLYYGGQFALAELGNGDMIYLFGLFIAVAELISYLFIRNFIQSLPRRLSTIMSFLMAILCCSLFIVYGFTAHSATVNCIFCVKLWYMIFLACLIRIFTSFSFAIQTLFVNEFYPTKIRTIGSGFVFSVGIAGSFVAPYNISLSQKLDINPYLIIGFLSLTGLFGTMLIRETLGCKLEDDVQKDHEYEQTQKEFA